MKKPTKDQLAKIDNISLWPFIKLGPVLVMPEEEGEPLNIRIYFHRGTHDEAAVALGRWLAELAGVYFCNTRGTSYDYTSEEET